MKRIALGLLILLATLGCSTLPAELEPFDGTFDYVAFDSQGARVLEGTLVLNVANDGGVSGTWEINWVEGADQNTVVGPQLGTGSLLGTVTDGDLFANLNPQIADDNVVLQGAYNANRISGRWDYSTFSGPTAAGDFTATKR